MRKGISSLCGVVHERMKSDVRNGDVFIFIGQSRKLMKLLHAEDGGMVMYVKRLEAGRFRCHITQKQHIGNYYNCCHISGNLHIQNLLLQKLHDIGTTKRQ